MYLFIESNYQLVPRLKQVRESRHTSSLFICASSGINKQKQPPEVFCKKRFSKRIHKIHRKTRVPESVF